MSASDDLLDREADRAFLRPFRLGVLGVAALFLAVGGLIAAFGSTGNRPEGVAERWLADVGDTRRDGVRAIAAEHAEEVGPLSLAEDLLPEGSTDGRAAFVDLEVGKASEDPQGTTVPFRLHQRVDGSTGPAVDGTIVLRKDADDDWRIVGVEDPIAGREVPSEGGRPAAEAPLGLFVGALVVAVVVVAACSVAVRAAGRAAEG